MTNKEREELLELVNDLDAVCYEYESFLPIVLYLKKHLTQPEQEPLSDSILTKEIDIIKDDGDFSNVRPWQIYYVMRKTEELHGIGVGDE